MLVSCWSPKGGTGTTVVTALLGLLLARSSPGGAVVADLAGDLPAALGLPEPSGQGLGDWLAASADVGGEALGRLEVEVGRGLRLLPRGAPGGRSVGARSAALTASFVSDPRPVVADCGAADRSPGLEVAAGATVSLLVLRPCYLGLRRALAAPLRGTAVILVSETGRSLRHHDIEDVLGVPVWAEVPFEPALSRAVDAGLLASRTPRNVERSLARAVATMAGAIQNTDPRLGLVVSGRSEAR